MNNTTTHTTTCQICARAIKANTGVIAHHGYQRPGNGWQTASCMGAQYLPYEQSRDRIQPVVEQYKGIRQNNIDREKELLNSPPATLTRFARSSYGEDQVVTRPENFDAEAAIAQGGFNPSNQDDVYRSEYRSAVRNCRINVKEITAAIEFLQQRYDAWGAK